MHQSQPEKLRREGLVIKSNILVQKTTHDLSLEEQKAVAYLCSLIDHRNNEFILDYVFDIQDYCKTCGFEWNSGRNYANIRNTLFKLRNNAMILEYDGKKSPVGWLDRIELEEHSGKVKIRFDERLIPHLFGLKNKFYKFGLYNILALKSAYSAHLYEYFQSLPKNESWFIKLDDLKYMLRIEKIKSYNNFKDFRVKVLENSINEINSKTNLSISYKIEKTGRKVTALYFTIKEKEPEERLKTMMQVLLEVENSK